MEEMGQSSPQPVKPEKANGNKLAWIVAIVMTLAAGSLGYLYFTKDEAEPQSQNQQTQNTEELEESTRTIYQAEIGKFSINLSNSYGVVENLDGGGEGGSATDIEIGSAVESATNVIEMSLVPFSIFAVADRDATLADNSQITAIMDTFETTKVGDITFADTPAVSYKSEGLYTQQHVIFVKNGILYHIEFVVDSSKKGEETLAAVEAGWAFAE